MTPTDPAPRVPHSIERRSFLAMIAGGLLAAAVAGEAQQAGKVWRIGYIGGGSAATTPSEPFVQELRRLGWIEGQNMTIHP